MWSCHTMMAACLTNSHRSAIGVFRKSVEHAFCAALYASCLFFPLHLSKIEDHGYKFVAFCTGARLDRVAKEHTYGTLRHDICNIGKKRYEWNDQRTLLQVRRRRGRKNWPK